MNVSTFGSKGFKEVSPEALATLLKTSNDPLWVDIEGPTDQDIHVMQEVFKFHPLAIEDTRNQEQRPKAEEYNDYLFIILNPVDCNDGEIDFRELDVFVGRNYIVTVHPEREPVIEETKQRIENGGGLVPCNSAYALYALMDIVIDSYFPVLDFVGEEMEKLENDILERPRPDTLNRLFGLKRSLLNMWRIIWPQRDIFATLTHHRLGFLDQESLEYYLRDVSDHLLWIADMVSTSRDTLTSMMDLHMSSISNRLNKVVNRLTVVTIVSGVMAVITGFYGMNFQTTWPPFDNPGGVPFVLGLMLIVASAVLVLFRLLKWY
jgi:magnesium transporter